MSSFGDTHARPHPFRLPKRDGPTLSVVKRYGEAFEQQGRIFGDRGSADVSLSYQLVAGNSIDRLLIYDAQDAG